MGNMMQHQREKIKKIEKLMSELDRTRSKLVDYRNDVVKNIHNVSGTSKSGSARRATMDLTRSLSDFRRDW